MKKKLAVIALVLAVVVVDSGLGLFNDWLDASDGPDGFRSYVQQVEQRWGGAGHEWLLVDDFSAYQGRHMEGIGIPSYYGGAAPEPFEGPQQWAYDQHRWGADQGWDWMPGAYRFGEPGSSASYRAGGDHELVSPVVDLRAVPAVSPGPIHASGPDTVVQDRYPCDSPASPQRFLPTEPCYPESLPQAAYGEVFPGGEFEVEPILQSAAALVLRHHYDFNAHAGGLIDGGRVEVGALDGATGTWRAWQVIEPTDRSLVIDGTTIRARQGDPIAPSEVLVDVAAGTVDLYAADAWRGGVEGGDPVLEFVEPDSTRPSPHLYQGNIVSAPGAWRGFGGTSPWVESVFDLSGFAGELVRLRFVTYTQNNPDGEPLHQGHAGWFIDEARVLGDAGQDIQVLGLIEPGDGALVAAGAHVLPQVIVHNPGYRSESIRLTGAVADLPIDQQAMLGVGPLARGNVPLLDGPMQVIAGQIVDVQTRLHKTATTSAGALDAADGLDPVHRFRFLSGPGGGWEPSSIQVRRIGADLEGNPIEEPTRYFAAGQQGVVRASILNLGPAPIAIRAGSQAPGDWDVRPAIVDESGQEYGVWVATQQTVTIPPSRLVAGSFGQPIGDTQLEWVWSGTQEKRPLQLVLLRNGSAGPDVALHGGDIRVDSAVPPKIQVDYENAWNTTACNRIAQEGARRGLLECPPGAMVTTAEFHVSPVSLLRGNGTGAQVTWLGERLDVVAETRTQASTGAWHELGHSVAAGNGTWRTSLLDLPDLPAGFNGALRVKFNSSDAFVFDSALASLVLASGDRLTLGRQDWDVALGAIPFGVQASSDTGLLWLTGDDEISRGVNAEHDAGLNAGARLRADNGSVELYADWGPPPFVDWRIDTGRVVEDSFATLAAPLDLRNVTMPRLTWLQWHEFGPYLEGRVEVAIDTMAQTTDSASNRI